MPIISNSVQNNGGSASTGIHTPSRTYRSGNHTLTLREGQTLKGVVSDVHGNEITLSMEDGSSFTGKLPDANQYSIGQKAAFQIVSLSDNTIYMKATTGAYLLDMEDTVEQALEEAGLPKSTRNLEVVRSLLQNKQSISRQNIMSSIQLCAKYPHADVHSVITMNRLGMPMSESSVKQFENYQNQTHQLMYKMETLGNSIGDMLNSIGSQVPRLSKEVGTQLLNLALESSPTPEELQLAESVAAQTEVNTSNSVSNSVADNIASDVATEEIAQNASNEDAENISPEDSSQKTSEKSTSEGSAENNGPFARMRQLFTAITDSTAAARSAMTASGIAEDYRTPFIHEQTGFVLSPEERREFASLLSDFPLSEELKQGVQEGTFTIRNFLTEIKEAFPHMNEEQAAKLISSKGFQTITKHQFINNWTISPEHLKEEGSLNEIYDKMSNQFKALSHFSEQVLGKDVFSQVSENAADMSDNLDFMKTLNETFQYIQLPLKLQKQNAHGDLYVMTKKEALKKDPNHLKVLLHLDMDKLGTLDIHISKENSAVSTKFYVSAEDTLRLLERNINLLSDAIHQQGYGFQSELMMKEKNMDVVNDFVSSEAPVGDMKRYNFDLRA